MKFLVLSGDSLGEAVIFGPFEDYDSAHTFGVEHLEDELDTEWYVKTY